MLARSLLLGALALACSEPPTAGTPATPAPARTYSFASDVPGAAPAGFEATGGRWEVALDTSAPADGRVLAQLAARAEDEFNVALLVDPQPADLDLSVAMLPIAGDIDRGGGLVWRARDARNYYLARWNPLERNLRTYRVVDGVRTQLGTADLEPEPGWSTIAVRARGAAFEVFLDGRSHLAVEDATFAGPGRIGLWTKADARTHFDDLLVRGTAR